MLADGLFPQGFLDYGGDRLVLTGDGLSEPPQMARQTPPPGPKEDENAILAEIRAVNNAIDNENTKSRPSFFLAFFASFLERRGSCASCAALSQEVVL